LSKGDSPRPVNPAVYGANYDRIFKAAREAVCTCLKSHWIDVDGEPKSAAYITDQDCPQHGDKENA